MFDNFSEWLSQAEEIIIMKGEGLGQISLRFLQSSSTKANLSVTTFFYNSSVNKDKDTCE